VCLLKRLQQLQDEGEQVANAEWLERMHRLLDALAAERRCVDDFEVRRNRGKGGDQKAANDQIRLKPMLDIAIQVAREIWLGNGRKWRRGDNTLIENKTRDKLRDDRKSLVAELPGKRLRSIRKQIAAELPPTETDKGKI
jgi:hypothetical protein